MSKALAVNATASGRQRFFDFLYKWGMLLTVVALIAVFGLASDNFLDPFNIINILRSIAIVTVIAIGVSVSLTIGGFDLSVGSTASLANALVISLFVWHGFGTTEAILVTLALCTLVGLFNFTEYPAGASLDALGGEYHTPEGTSVWLADVELEPYQALLVKNK